MANSPRKQAKAIEAGIANRKLARATKRAALAKFKRIGKQNAMIDNKQDEALDARLAKRHANQHWYGRQSDSTDYRTWRTHNAKPSGVTITRH